jgi:hypothetical protein
MLEPDDKEVKLMNNVKTVLGSIDDYEKGDLEIINDNPKYYTFSNIFDVANRSKPYEKVVVAKNMEYVIETVRTEGVSPWYTCSHDEYVWQQDGEVQIDLIKLDSAEQMAPPEVEGTVQLDGEPSGPKMGWIKLGKGHQALLPKGSAYRFTASQVGVLMQQTIQGELTVEKWAEICES